MKIDQILDKIDENHLFVPAFQREYVWKKDDAKKLVASLIREYPTGTLLSWETNNPPELKGKHKYDARQGAVRLILDGQQRITTLYMLIRGEIPPYYTPADITNDPRGLYVNVTNLDLQYYKKNIMQNNPNWLNVTDIFQRKIHERDVINNIRDIQGDLSREEEDIISNNFRAVENIPRLEFIEQSIPVKASLKEAIDIFYIVNDSGVNLTDAELALAQISGYWPEAREEFKSKLKDLEKDGFVFNLDFIIYCLLAVMYTLGSDMTKLHDSENDQKLRNVWLKLRDEVLDYTVNILRSQAYVDHSKEINSVYALVPIVYYAYQKEGDLSQGEIKKVIKWFYYSQLRQRYVSQLPQKLDKDLKIVERSKNPFDELINIIKLERPLEIYPEEFIGVGVSNPLYSLMRWYFKSRDAICFTTGIGIRQNMGKKYALEWDHVFPYSLLKERGYGMNNRHKYALAQEITNRVVLTQLANRRKSNKLPENYLADIKKKFPNALKLQSIPQDEKLWKMDRFEVFLEERREMLAQELNSYLENITKTEEAVSEITLDELIAEGESNGMEFKSSLRWSYTLGKIDKKLEDVILKSIAAFSNSDGGTLLIGVDDEGNILGLEKDCMSLNGSKDEFEIHLRNLANKTFGRSFTSSNLSVTFPMVNDTEICQIEISKGRKPAYVTSMNDNGHKTEKFYVRSGNTSQELALSEVADYIGSRFKN